MDDLSFIDFPIIDLPDIQETLTHLSAQGLKLDVADGPRSVLVLYAPDGASDFLLDVLRACGYSEPEKQAWLIPWPTGQLLDLSALRDHLTCNRIILFGQSLPELGLHLNLASYSPVQLGKQCYLKADSLATIRDEKAAGNTRKAAALWQALKTHFLHTQI
ncbi:MAG: hypothetical protein AAF544_04900 [Bacteroidota bacterium]